MQAYQAHLKEAYAIEIRWSESVAQTGVHHVVVRQFHFYSMKPNRWSIEEEGKRKLIWNDKKGIDLDLANHKYKLLDSQPTPFGVEFLLLPQFSTKDDDYSRLKVKVDGNHLRAINQGIDDGDITDYWFSEKSKLLVRIRSESLGMRSWTGTMDYRFTIFDTFALLSSTNFPVDPPSGFTKD